MNILMVIMSGEEHYNFEYYGVNDIMTMIEARFLIDKRDDIVSYFTNKTNQLKDIDDFIDYLFIRKFVQFKEVSSYIKDEFKEIFDNILLFLEKRLSSYNAKDLINYINNHIEDILVGNKYNLTKTVFEIVFKYFDGCPKAILYIMENRYYIILDNFYDIEKIINSNQEYKSRMLSDSQFDKIKSCRLKKYLNVISWYINNKKVNIEEVAPILDKVIEHGKEILKKINDDNVIQYDAVINIIYKFLVSINHKEANVFEQMIKMVEKVVDNYLEKHGNTFSYEKSVEELLKWVKEDKSSLEVKMLMITHSRIGKSKQLESFYSQYGKYNKKHIKDMCSTNIPHDDYFTVTKQQLLESLDNMILQIVQYFISGSMLIDFFSIITARVESICNYYNINYNELEFENDFNILLNLYIALHSSNIEGNHYLSKGLNYGIALFECSLIEKLLRNIYKNMNKELYIKTDWFSLGNLLNSKDQTMLKIFNEDEIKIFRYYLVDGNNGSIGYNYRNNFAHYKNITTGNMNIRVSLNILYIFLTIINDIFLITI